MAANRKTNTHNFTFCVLWKSWWFKWCI